MASYEYRVHLFLFESWLGSWNAYIEDKLLLSGPGLPVFPSWSVESHRWQFYPGNRCSPAETVRYRLDFKLVLTYLIIQRPFWSYDTDSCKMFQISSEGTAAAGFVHIHSFNN